jgi:hypothetical protein
MEQLSDMASTELLFTAFSGAAENESEALIMALSTATEIAKITRPARKVPSMVANMVFMEFFIDFTDYNSKLQNITIWKARNTGDIIILEIISI